MKFTAKITMNGRQWLTPDAVAGLVGQHPMVQCGAFPTRGEVTAAELEGQVLTLTIEVQPGSVLRSSMDASMGYIPRAGVGIRDYRTNHTYSAAEQVDAVDLLEIMPAPAEPATPQDETPPSDHTFVHYLRLAYADPGSVVGARLGRTRIEPIGNWAARAALAVVDERDRLTHILTCSQCGRGLFHRACGPTHAILKRDPWRHRAAPKPKWDPPT
jgi:hypothetical protein